MDDTRSNDLIWRNHERLAAAAKAWSDFTDTVSRIDHAREQERIWRGLWYGGQTEPYHRVITYDVTVTGPLGFQVSVLGLYLHDARLMGDFGSLQEAEAFADRMREIDAGPSHLFAYAAA
jgi:hypothetical protein